MVKINAVFQAVICLIVAAFLSSCASLTKSQLTEVNAFGQLTKDFATYPGKLITNLNDIRTQQQLYITGSIMDAEKHQKAVVTLYEDQKKSAKLNQQAVVALQILSDYGQKLAHLTADVHSKQLDTAALSLGTNLDALIGKYNGLVPGHSLPTGIGAFFGKLVQTGGDLYIKDRQAKATKEFVTMGDTLISEIATKIEADLDGAGGQASIKRIIQQDSAILRTNYVLFLTRRQEKITINKGQDTVYTGQLDAWRSGSFDADKLYLQCLANLDADEQLRQQCLIAVRHLKAAHHQMLLDLQQKRKITDMYSTLQGYGTSVSQLYATFNKINS